MPWKDVCVRGRPAGGRVREDDIPKGDDPTLHNAGGPSPGILKFVDEVVRHVPPGFPTKPIDFPVNCAVQTYPGYGAADVHYEGRAADVFFWYTKPAERVFGDWLFDWCVANCETYLIQGVKFGERQWFSEMARGMVVPLNDGGDHMNHVHVELNGDGAAMNYPHIALPRGAGGPNMFRLPKGGWIRRGGS